MRVLVVEDERALREQLVKTLQRAGYAVDATDSGEEGVFMGSEYPVDVAVLDLGLPDIDGLEVLSRWRANGHSFPVLVLTARGGWTQKVEGLETGADDYLTKPFHIEEVLARLRALVRRSVRVFRETTPFPSEGAALPSALPGVGWSDHWSFWKAGYRALMITDTAPFRNPHYHEPSDLPDKLDFERMARVVQGVEAVVADLAGGQSSP